ncbi:hypothetical protein [Gimesia fumaroli]|uniref:Zinc-finger domain-containing protein n=1 Tax=Gimesia fumaroli TaxID=2527976 RepID=A0A518I7T9_9PLAN|nr:hypothetical protein [Gimesia fumaroli]QDV49165.1 hypothetical protein Enr17x_11820 [Gimesia fumaroli]
MNCDEAFELMTHPTDHQCEELLWHLQMCPRCQQMQETLAPALESFQQILDESTDLDEFDKFPSDFQQSAEQESPSIFPKTGQPFLSAETVRMAEQAATRLRSEAGTSQKQQTPAPKRYQKRLLNAALILVAGFLMGWGMSLDAPKSPLSPTANSLPGQQPCLWIAQRENGANSISPKTEREQASVQSVVLSCVACHLQSTAE